jgi:hypothetical protein
MTAVSSGYYRYVNICTLQVGIPPHVPGPTFAANSPFIDVQIFSAYPPGCSMANLTNCVPSSSFVADPNRTYYDWSLTPMGTPDLRITQGRDATPVWKGLPWPVAMLCTSCGGGAQLADGSYVYLVVTQFNRTWELNDHSKQAPCCNNSVVSFTSVRQSHTRSHLGIHAASQCSS